MDCFSGSSILLHQVGSKKIKSTAIPVGSGPSITIHENVHADKGVMPLSVFFLKIDS
jgi:hypothetical protein